MSEMNRKARYLLRMPWVGRQISDQDWDRIEVEAAKMIAELAEIYNSQQILLDDSTYQFEFNFEPLISFFNDLVFRHREFEKNKNFDIWRYSGDSSDCYIECSFSSKSNHPTALADQILEFLIYEMFIVMCIANPGVFNLDGASFVNIPEAKNIYGNVIEHSVSVSSHLPENAHYEWPRHLWLPHASISVGYAYKWVRSVYPRFSMIGDNPASRCLLAMLSLCRGDLYSGPSAAWVFNGLESLFSCTPGENRAALTRRVTTLLSIPDKHNRDIKKAIQKLYDLRSAFVHGGLKTIHPVRSEALDNRVDQEILSMMNAIDFGVALMISIFRELVSREIPWPIFEEALKYNTKSPTSNS